jgi:hypothetical protein
MIQSFHELSVRALRKIASTYNLHTMMKGYSKLTKEELITNLQKHLKIENDNLYFISKTHSFPIPKLPAKKYKKIAKKEKPVADSGEFEKAVKQFKKIEEEFKPENYKVKSVEELMPKKVAKEEPNNLSKLKKEFQDQTLNLLYFKKEGSESYTRMKKRITDIVNMKLPRIQQNKLTIEAQKDFQNEYQKLNAEHMKLALLINKLEEEEEEKKLKGGVMRTNFQPIIPIKMTPEERMKRREEFFLKKDPVPNYRLMLKGAGAQPARNALHQMAKASYEKNPPREIAGFILDQSYPTLKFYKDEASKTIIVAIRGTNATDTEDLKADASIAINGLENSRRFKKDLDILRSYQYNNSPNKYDYYGVGHSLGGAVMDGFLDMNLLKSGISYNPALQPKNFGKNNRDQRIYADDDLLYKTLGHNDPNAEVRKTKKGFFSRVVKALAPSIIAKPYEALEAHKLDQFEGGKKRRRNLK